MFMRSGILIELLALIALMSGIPVPVSATVALVAATPTSAIAIYRLLRSDKSGGGVLDVVFLFFTWTMLPCLLLLHATDRESEAVVRLIAWTRVFAAVSIWSLLNRWHRDATEE